ncbi:protein kinase C and casein kinase substrate in neurons protein 2 isoform X2 [Lepeophtheirus salmonis]|uniref:protein kinase C and casein kinase substrate in neurons protein 2 isoform X2 n=1 Tax=Lepeophtheirus salmonis TaxID=72036 RepID=UPI001AE1A37A|nr:protein kinase C and casein kinase substrate in neurons protein 2-like isoform X2 [Lepeophtheirus salmonis]
MSHHSDEAMLIAGSESFWEPSNYKTTTKRIEDGNKLCDELVTLVRERSEIEKTYAKSLKAWANKWSTIIEKGPEYGTTEAGWKGVLVEADRRCELHLRVKEALLSDVNNQLKIWQKENYHKTLMHIREKKDMDEQFKKAQKPWLKLFTKVNKAKADYHYACKTEKSAIINERNASGNTSMSQDNVQKCQERVKKAKENVVKCKENYEIALQDVNGYNSRYIEDMKEVFEKCQRMEAQRLQTFKDTLFSLQKCLNISDDPELPQIYEEFYHTVNNADHEKDLKWWSNTYGVNMPMNWPQFEEYTEELRDITSKRKHEKFPDGNITLINQRAVGDDLPEYPSGVRQKKSNSISSNNKDSRNGKAISIPTSKSSEQEISQSQPQEMAVSNGNSTKDSNPFDDDEWDDEQVEPLVDNGEKGVPVKALYDYDAAESDELDFKAGDCFEKLEDEDEQGWCKGRKDGKVGLYPANYIEVL